MKKFLSVLFLFFCCSVTFAATERLNKIVFFGDSLTDNGNLYSLLHIIPKSPPYYAGRFSNGPLWSDILSDFFKSHLGADSLNYAVGGATAISHQLSDGDLPYEISQELNHYLMKNIFADKSRTLFVIWIGANDYTGGQSDVEGITTKIVDKTMSLIDRLMRNGGRNFLILNLPDFAKTPYAKGVEDPKNLTDLSQKHNEKLMRAIVDLRAHSDIKITIMDTYFLFNEMIANPEKYNGIYHTHFTNLTDACWTGGYTLHRDKNAMHRDLQRTLTQERAPVDINATTEHLMTSSYMTEAYRVGELYESGVVPCSNPDNYLFWDKLHPTTIVHRVLADLAVNTLAEAGMID